MFHKLRTYFLTGTIAAVPVLVTIWLIRVLIKTVDGWVASFLPNALQTLAVPGLGVLLAVIGLTVLGLATANVVGRVLIAWGDRIVSRIPLIGTIYRPVRQILETFRPGARGFRSVVLIDYPHPGTQAIGFLTADAPPAIGEGKVSVFVPTSPNLYAGFLLFVTPAQLTPVSMSVEEAIALLVSAGLVQNQNGPKTHKNVPV